MKKLLLLTILFTSFLQAQCPPELLILSTQQQVDDLLTLYPDCSEYQYVWIKYSEADPITNLNGLQNVTTATGWFTVDENPELTNLDGLNALISVGEDFSIYADAITDISALENLESVGGTLNIINSHITSLAPLNNLTNVGGFKFNEYDDTLVDFDLVFNMSSIPGDLYISTYKSHINGLESLTSVGGEVSIDGFGMENLIDISGLQNLTTVGNRLYIYMYGTEIYLDNLVSVGETLQLHLPYATSIESLSNLTTVGEHLIITQTEALENLHGLESLVEVGGFVDISENLGLLSLDGLQNLETCSIGLIVNNNSSLIDISALSNIEITDYYQMKFINNPNLPMCSYPSICSYLEVDDAQIAIYDNAPGCNGPDEILAGCVAQNNVLSGTIIFDYENTGCTITDYGVYNAKVTALNETGDEYVTYTDAEGNYHLYLPEGNYTIENQITAPGYTVAPTTVAVVYESVGGEDTANFCVSSNEAIDNVKVTVYPVNEARPGFDAAYTIVCENQGTTIASGSIVFEYPEDKVDILESQPVANGASEGELTWNYSELNPFQSVTYTVTLNILPPMINNNGDVLNYTATIDAGPDDVIEDDTYTLAQVLVGSYDPNDKTVMEGEEVIIDNAGDYLTYRIRFQNTGEVSAVFIRLEDQLDENLDWNTFEPLAASHDYRIELVDGFLKVYFDDIFLPAEEDDQAGSNGFFMYRIKPKAGMVIGNSIENTASIFFDYNLPIITNTVTTEFVETAGITGNDLLQVAIYPNPATAVLNFRTATAITAVELYNGLGQKVTALKAEAIDSLNVSQLANGVYFCHLHDGHGNTSIHKIIINK